MKPPPMVDLDHDGADVSVKFLDRIERSSRRFRRAIERMTRAAGAYSHVGRLKSRGEEIEEEERGSGTWKYLSHA